MLIECLAPAASGKSTITRKLRKCFHSPILLDVPKCKHHPLARESFAEAVGELKEQVEYYEHRRLMKQFAERLDFHWCAKQQDKPIFISMGILQCVVDLFMKYEGRPESFRVHELVNRLPMPDGVITIHTGQDILVDRHMRRTRGSPKEQRLYMNPSEEVVRKYIAKQAYIIALCSSTARVFDREVCLFNNFESEKQLFNSNWWTSFIERIEEIL